MNERVTSPPELKVWLRTVTASDLAILFEHQCDPMANDMAAFPARDRDAFMDHWTRILADDTVPAMSVLLDGEVVGYILSWVQDRKRLVGYWIGREHWGIGVATKALCTYLQIVTDRPLHALVARHNVGSIRVLEKCGFEACAEETRSLPEPADSIEEVVYKHDATYGPTA